MSSSSTAEALPEKVSPCDYLLLTSANWERVAKDVFVEEFRKTKTETKTTLCELIQLNNELKVICHQLTETKANFQKETEAIEKRLTACRQCQQCGDDKNLALEKMIAQIEERNACMSAEIQKFEAQRDDKLALIREKISDVDKLKKKLESQNLNGIDALEQFKTNCKKPVVMEAVDRRIQSMRHHYAMELKYIAQLEEKLKCLFRFIQKLDNKDADSCASTSTISSEEPPNAMDELHAQCYQQQRQREETLEYIKTHLGPALIEAFSALNIYKPQDPIDFIANYLMHYRHNDLKLQKREENLQNLLATRDACFKKAEEEENRFCG